MESIMKKFFLGFLTLATLGISNAEAACYQARKCVVPFVPSLNWTLGGDINCIFRVNTNARGAAREVNQRINELDSQYENALQLPVDMIGIDPFATMNVVILPNIPDSQCQ
jgi:hypothetical protein